MKHSKNFSKCHIKEEKLEGVEMIAKDIIRGESKNVEFKVTLPKDSEKYIKTIIAFANTQGGQIIVGIDDRMREVKGVDSDSLFKMMAVFPMQYRILVSRRLFRTLNHKL